MTTIEQQRAEIRSSAERAEDTDVITHQLGTLNAAAPFDLAMAIARMSPTTRFLIKNSLFDLIKQLRRDTKRRNEIKHRDRA